MRVSVSASTYVQFVFQKERHTTKQFGYVLFKFSPNLGNAILQSGHRHELWDSGHKIWHNGLIYREGCFNIAIMGYGSVYNPNGRSSFTQPKLWSQHDFLWVVRQTVCLGSYAHGEGTQLCYGSVPVASIGIKSIGEFRIETSSGNVGYIVYGEFEYHGPNHVPHHLDLLMWSQVALCP